MPSRERTARAHKDLASNDQSGDFSMVCDTLVVVRDGTVLFGKNSDRDPNEAQRLEWLPAREYRDAERVDCTWMSIPQARRTHRVLISRPYWIWGAEMGANEHGVVIGNEAVFNKTKVPKTGLTGMDLLRLALERAMTADEAVSLIESLARTHGQGGRCGHEQASFRYFSSFIVADRNGAWVLDTDGGDFARERVTSGVRSISNGLSVSGFFEGRRDRVRSWVCACDERRARTTTLASGARDPIDVMRVLRDHGEGHEHPQYQRLQGAMGAPCMHAGGVATGSQTVASWVSELTEGGARHFATATAAPCVSLFKPVDIDDDLYAPCATTAGAPLDSLGPPPRDRFDERTLFWRHERLHRRWLRDMRAVSRQYRNERDAMERRFFEHRTPPRQAFDEGQALLTTWLSMTRPPQETRPGWLRKYWHVRDEAALFPEAP